jgi:hypothetical protein
MGRGARNGRSRSERRLSKERAASATTHGLPIALARPGAPRAVTPSSPTAQAGASPEPGLPVPVKLLGLGLLLLGLVYGLTLLRERRPTPEPGRIGATLESEAKILSPPSTPASATQIPRPAGAIGVGEPLDGISPAPVR